MIALGFRTNVDTQRRWIESTMGLEDEHYTERPYYATWWFEWLVLLLCFSAGWLLWNQLDGLWAENANLSNRYIELARSIAQGQGYSLPHGDGRMPYLETPPLYPFMLAMIMWLFGTTKAGALANPFLGLNLSLYLLSVILVYTFIGHRIKRPYSFIITLLYTISPMTLSAVKSMTPELTYLVLSLIAMVTIDKYFARETHRIKRNQIIGSAICVVLALITMNLGFALLAAFFGLTLYKLGSQRAVILLTTVFLFMTPWFLREGFHRTFSQVIPARFEHTLAKHPQMVSPFKHPGRFTQQLWTNADVAMGELTRNTLGSLDLNYLAHPLAKQTGVNQWEFHFADMPWIRWSLATLTLLGIGIGLYQYSGIGSLYLLMFILMSLFFPLENSLSAFPVLPLKLFFLYNGIMWVAKTMKKMHFPIGKVAVPALTLMIILNSVNGYLLMLTRSASHNVAFQRPIFNKSGLNPPVSEAAYLKAMRWLRANTPASAHIIAENPKEVKLMSQRFARPPHQSHAPSHVKRHMLHQADYILEEPSSAVSREFITPALEQFPQSFRLVYNDAKAQIRIWQVVSKRP